MNRIKFRAWDKKDKMFCHVGEIHYCQGGIKVFGPGHYIGNGWATEENGFNHECDVVLQQFTGLFDKNGKEIYEGDIIESEIDVCSERGEFEDYEESDRFQVEFINGMFGRKLYGERIEPLLTNTKHFTIKKYNVIGNIFENPELLK